MDTTRIDLNLLLTLEALLAEQNVTKAAARLHLSQPAVSAQLNRLRDLFDDPLLLPARRGMTPTAKALELIVPVRESLEKLRHTLHSHRDFYPQHASLTVTIACTDYIQAALVMPLVLALRQKAPGVRIAVRHLDMAQLDHQLASGEVDLVFASHDSFRTHLRTTHLFNESYVLIGRRDHPALKADLPLEAFVKLEHVIVSPSGGSFTTPIDDALAAFGHKRNVVMSAASFLFIPEIVQKSDLVALIPRRLLQVLSAQLAVIELPWLAEQFDICLIWHERSHSHAGHRWVRELIVEMNSETES
ncbi:HTH-type transcriptional regulator LeuO [Buttiauxella agrestis]|uniref:HTH-type transcriptional regulator LeuO n=1 Tax=Buttiauxella agrestis TaxID=82977 RepID=A0A381C7Y3_9ENTR|nr:LysR family transcriptional regulator [Buttiauxella agrestis]SUW64008.1 HTH-type transcriptional regulator LeuO [Buttiauxella agrestis]